MRTCERCGALVPEIDLQGLCPICVARELFTPDAEAFAPSARNTSEECARDFGGLELLEEIARGGMGVVFKARQTRLNRTVAVKMILTGRLASSAEIMRFQAEAEAAANLRHPNIVAVHEVGEFKGQHYFSMDYVEGKNLAEIIREGGTHARTPTQWAACVKTIAEAIHYAHECGILHRDLKPSNVLIDAFGQPRITDFGLAKRQQNGAQQTLTGQVLGSPSFMPPEQAAARHKSMGPQSDVYSIGAILYYLLTGQPPFTSATSHETIAKVLEEQPLSPRVLNPEMPMDLETISLKCLEKDRHRRYASAQELAADLGRFLDGEPILARRVSSLEAILRTYRKHAREIKRTIALVAVFLGIALVVNRYTPSPRSPTAGPDLRAIAEMPIRSANGISGIIDGRIYITTASDGHGSNHRRFLHVYDPRNNSWKRLTDSFASHSSGAGGAIAGKLYAVSGGQESSDRAIDVLEVYDPPTDRWAIRSPIPTPRIHCTGSVLGGKLYVIGGHDGTNWLAKVESYDPQTDLWATEPSMLTARVAASAAAISNTLYVVGGQSHLTKIDDTIESWEPGGRWTARVVTNMAPVGNLFLVAADDQLYAAGGCDLRNGATAVFQVHSPGRHWTMWQGLEPMPEARYSGSGAQVMGQEIYFFGGWDNLTDHLPHSDVFVYSLLRNSWRRSLPSKSGGP